MMGGGGVGACGIEMWKNWLMRERSVPCAEENKRVQPNCTMAVAEIRWVAGACITPSIEIRLEMVFMLIYGGVRRRFPAHRLPRFFGKLGK